MKYHRKYGDLIWTDHALDKLRARKLSQENAWSAFENPENVRDGKSPTSKEYSRRIGDRTVTTIAKQNEKKEWIVISAWVDPPYHGTEDALQKNSYHKFQQSSFWRKIWLSLKSQIGP